MTVHFIQKFFYVHDIDRDSIEITAETRRGSDSWYSVRSIGTELVLEGRQVGCCCDSHLLGDGSSCPNRAYALQWMVYNLVTGKPLLDSGFRNQHWAKSTNDNNTNSHADSNAESSSCGIYSSRMKPPKNYTSVEDGLWYQILSILDSFPTYSELETYVLLLGPEYTKCMHCTVQKFRKRIHVVDDIAQKSKPPDAPQNHLYTVTARDGNCCPRTLNIGGFGDDSTTY